MTEHEREVRLKLKSDFKHYANRCLKIRTKEGSVEPFQMNEAQDYIHACLERQKAETGKVRAIILKGRQQGCSTYIGGRFFHQTTHRSGVRAFILTHEAESTAALFEMTSRYLDQCPALVKPTVGASNTKELIFDGLDSGYKVGTANNKSVGRGTTVQYFHGSEVAFWNNAAEHAKGILQAVPDAPGTEIILESTANGVGNYFHEQWQRAESGESEFQAIFVPWYWQPEYTRPLTTDFSKTPDEEKLAKAFGLTDGQIMFRRQKIYDLSSGGIDGASAFAQEYPFTAQEAFQMSGTDQLIKPDIVTAARKTKVLALGDLIIGVDPARFGEDRTAIIKRRGRAAYDLQTYKGKSTMEVAGLVHALILEEKPAQVAIDVGGLGAGVVDRLIELGHDSIVVPVNFGSSALDNATYINRRAEMWWNMRNWLAGELPVMIPDLDELNTDLCAPQYKYDSQSRRKLETKDEMRKRGMRSPDTADCLALTFAEPVNRREEIELDRFVVDRVAGY